MNLKRYIIAAAALFVFMYVYEAIMHGVVLMQLYIDTPNIWRSTEAMMTYMPFNIAVMGALAVWMTFLFTRFYKVGGASNGLRFGFYIGVLAGIQAAGAYYYLPISATLAACWFIVNLIESAIGGFIVGAIYRN